MRDAAIWAICFVATAGVIVRPFRWPEAIWAVAGALLLLVLRLLPPGAALSAVGQGADVYLFLIGMMLLSEVARAEGVFDWLAMHAVDLARGSPRRLFGIIYLVGVVVTVFLSNDATAVVLTPAVYTVAKRAETEPLPLLFACAMVANAASFVLPISNPANLVLYGRAIPPLGEWLGAFALPSLGAILATWAALYRIERRALGGTCRARIEEMPLRPGGKLALLGIGGTAILLLTVSAMDKPLGLPTCLAGLATAALTLIRRRAAPWLLVRNISWGVLPLVAGLFVLVETLDRSGVTAALAHLLGGLARHSAEAAGAAAGGVVAVAVNLTNNLPAGLIAGTALRETHVDRLVADCLMIAVDLGPNLSVTGSLATILWLSALKREGESVGFWRFLKVGAVTMPAALIPALGLRLLIG